MFFLSKNKIIKKKHIQKKKFLIDKNFLFVSYFKFSPSCSTLIRKNILNLKYIRYFNKIQKSNVLFNIRLRKLFSNYLVLKKKILWLFFNTYNAIYYQFIFDYFYALKLLKKRKKMNYLIFSFKKNKLFVNLLNFYKKNFLFLSSGLFIKFFEKKKSFKKNKIIKILLAKYLRKIFILAKVNNIIFLIKSIPVYLLEIINFLNQPIIHKFINPYSNKVVEETSTKTFSLRIMNIIFLKNKSFCVNKIKKKGRIKRKIIRKVILENKLID
jgi:hypothetical protein